MFLKSITLHGFLSYKDKKTISFDYNKNSSRGTNGIYINQLRNFDFISGFSFIFDPKHASNIDCKGFIHPRAKGNSYVEIHFWRSREDSSDIYDWLCCKELTFKRTLQNPKNIFVNKKRYDANSIHSSLQKLGIESINNIHVHRLIDIEIGKLNTLNGIDFWDMLMKMLECEELIEMAERKEGVVKKQLIKERYSTIANSITNQLTQKLEIRDEIRERIKINRQFFTLYYILTERRTEVLKKYKNFYSQEVIKLEPEVREMLNDRVNNQTQKRVDLEEMMSDRTYFKEVRAAVDNLDVEISNYERNQNGIPISKCLELINSCKLKEIDKTTATQSMIAAWKIYLKSAKENEQLETEIERWTRYLKDADQCEIFEEFEDEYVNLDFTKIHAKEMETAKRVTELTSKLLESRKQLLKFSSNAQILAIKGNFEHTLPNTIFEIEKVVKGSSEFTEDYIGPVFKYFNNTSQMDIQVWHQIKDISNFILFRKADTAGKFVKEFREKATKSIPNYQFKILCIDEIEEKVYGDEIHDSETFMSLRKLISKNAPSSIRKVLETLLQEFLIIKTDKWESNEILKNFKIIEVKEGISTIHHHSKAIQLVSHSKEFWDKLGKGPVTVIQKIYDQIQQQVKIAMEIKDMEKLQNELSEMSTFERRETLENYTKAVFKLKKKPSVFKILSQLLEDPNLATQIDTWNVAELKKQINQEMFKSQIDKDDDDEYQELRECLQKIQKLLDGVKEDVADTLIKLPQSFSFDSNPNAREYLVNKRQELQNILDNNEPRNIHLHQIECSSDFLTNYIDDPEKYYESITNCRKAEFKRAEMEKIIKTLSASLDIAHDVETSPMFFDQSTYDDCNVRETDELIQDFMELRRKLMELNRKRMIDLRRLSLAEYKKLVDSIGNVQKYAEEDDFAPLKIKKRAYPLMNVIAVKILKDTVSNFTSTYNHVLADYLQSAELFFFTNPENGTDRDHFSWNCFDLARLKAIEFVETWKSDKMRNSIDVARQQRIKGLLLILYIINYMSAFKFLILSEKMFDNFDDDLVEKIQEVLKAVSPYVQIIIYKERNYENDATMSQINITVQNGTKSHADGPEPMEVDNDDIDNVSILS